MGKNILVTGASSGIGEATARYLSEQGYSLVITARREDKLQKLAEELPASVLVYPMDMLELDSIQGIFEFCREKEIKLDGLVHCAGIGGKNPIRTANIQDLEQVMRINYLAFVELMKGYTARKVSNDNGSIVAISSLASHTCYGGTGGYAASKNALNAIVKVMAKEYARRKIRVNAILPAMVKTPMTESDAEEEVKKNQPYGFIEAKQIAYMIEFLLSDKSRFVTGSEIPISGGMQF